MTQNVLHKRTVAVVDDDTTVLSALSSLVRSVGYAVSTYVSGEAFLASCGLEDVCCVVSDIQMPGGMSGFDLIGAIARRNLHIPVVLMTGLVDDGLRARAGGSGAVAFLQKPVDSDALIGHIEAACPNR